MQVVDAPAADAPTAPTLVAPLEKAKADYAAFHFREALTQLDELARAAEAAGGGDLDARGLAEIFLYRALCRLETGAEADAWDDLIRAARLDPARVIDPAHVPPRAAATFKRAAQEVAQLPHVELQLALPADARIRVDGAEVDGTRSLLIGRHFVSVDADGFAPWTGMVAATAQQDRFAPSLRAYAPPSADALFAFAGSASRLLLGASVRNGSGWHLVVELVDIEGRAQTDSIALGDTPQRVPTEALVRRLLALPATRLDNAVTATPPARPSRRWWPWAVGAGAAAAVIAAGVTLGVVLGRPNPSGTVSGSWGL
jgi:hypothetical protein